MQTVRTSVTRLLLWAAGWNLRLLADLIRRATGRTPIHPAGPLHLPVETVTQQLRVIEILMTRIGRDTT